MHPDAYLASEEGIRMMTTTGVTLLAIVAAAVVFFSIKNRQG